MSKEQEKKEIPHKQTSMEERYSAERFIGEFMNDHGKIRWLRGIFFDEKEKIETILEYMRGIESQQNSLLTQARREEREDIVALIDKIHPYIDEGIYPDIDQTVIYNAYKTAFYRAKEDIAQKIKSNLHNII